jgi:hypothetical protein
LEWERWRGLYLVINELIFSFKKRQVPVKEVNFLYATGSKNWLEQQFVYVHGPYATGVIPGLAKR